ncbi:hypothetical protein ACFWGC_29510 [Cytobacillus pseudoceanisediminis]|uniref:hypothetical protein n=1 Tax=Cytobacillus pseudoceanisediminis TaxID=3051614 RepID=UPI00364AFF94
MSEKEAKFVVYRQDNHYYIMNFDQSLWTHNISNAKLYSEEEAKDKIEELENEGFEILLQLAPFSEELIRYRTIYG